MNAATEDEARAAKRREIEEKLAALKLQKEKEAEQKTRYFGNHPGITCDGCGVGPIVGYRYKCKSCPNHDVCETCYDQTKAGKVENGLGKQIISANAADHKFELFKDKAFSSLVKSAKVEGATEKKVRAVVRSPLHAVSSSRILHSTLSVLLVCLHLLLTRLSRRPFFQCCFSGVQDEAERPVHMRQREEVQEVLWWQRGGRVRAPTIPAGLPCHDRVRVLASRPPQSMRVPAALPALDNRRGLARPRRFDVQVHRRGRAA